MLETAMLIITTIALTLGVVSTTNTAATTYEKHTNMTYAQATSELLRKQELELQARIAEARYNGDAVREAEQQALLGALQTMERRLNPDAIVRQSIQERQAFLDDQWQVFKTTVAGYGLARGADALGFGKVAGSHMRGTNWPPDPNKNLVLYDPTTRQATRFILEPNRPILQIADYTEELGSYLDGIQNALEVARNTPPVGQEGLLSGTEAYTVASHEIARLTGMRPLPTSAGDYLARSAVRRAERENAQVASLPDDERVPFLRDQACARLIPLYANERDRYRSETLLASLAVLGCDIDGAFVGPINEKSDEQEPATVQENGEPEEQADDSQPPSSGPADQPSVRDEMGKWVWDGSPVLQNGSSPADVREGGYYVDCTASSGSLALEEREVSRSTGTLLSTLSVTAQIEAPPSVLSPGDSIRLGVTLTQSGSPPPWTPHHWDEGIGIIYRGQGPDAYIEDRTLAAGRHNFPVWDKGSSEPVSYSWTFEIPPGTRGQSLELHVEFFHAYTCRVTWNYVMK